VPTVLVLPLASVHGPDDALFARSGRYLICKPVESDRPGEAWGTWVPFWGACALSVRTSGSARDADLEHRGTSRR
jgi:hypothetical protein